MRFANIFFALLFVLSALVQYNDPDPLVWILIYLYGAFICVLGALRQFFPVLIFAGIALYLTYAVYLFFAPEGVLDWMQQHKTASIVSEMQATKPWIEQTREFFGLVILLFALALNLFWYFRNQKNQEKIPAHA